MAITRQWFSVPGLDPEQACEIDQDGVRVGDGAGGFGEVDDNLVVDLDRDVLAFDDAQIATRFALPAAQKNQPGGQRPKGARQLTSPVMSYLSVEPYEVRQEILIQARAAVQFLDVDDEGKGSIPVESLEPVKKGILDTVRKANPILIDGQKVEPILARADFVTLGPAGVIHPEHVCFHGPEHAVSTLQSVDRKVRFGGPSD